MTGTENREKHDTLDSVSDKFLSFFKFILTLLQSTGVIILNFLLTMITPLHVPIFLKQQIFNSHNGFFLVERSAAKF